MILLMVIFNSLYDFFQFYYNYLYNKIIKILVGFPKMLQQIIINDVFLSLLLSKKCIRKTLLNAHNVENGRNKLLVFAKIVKYSLFINLECNNLHFVLFPAFAHIKSWFSFQRLFLIFRVPAKTFKKIRKIECFVTADVENT